MNVGDDPAFFQRQVENTRIVLEKGCDKAGKLVLRQVGIYFDRTRQRESRYAVKREPLLYRRGDLERIFADFLSSFRRLRCVEAVVQYFPKDQTDRNKDSCDGHCETFALKAAC